MGFHSASSFSDLSSLLFFSLDSSFSVFLDLCLVSFLSSLSFLSFFFRILAFALTNFSVSVVLVAVVLVLSPLNGYEDDG